MFRNSMFVAFSLVLSACGSSGTNSDDAKVSREKALLYINAAKVTVTPPAGKYETAQTVMLTLKGEFPTKLDVLDLEGLSPVTCEGGTPVTGELERKCFKISKDTTLKYRIAAQYYDADKKENISITGDVLKAEYTF